MDTQTPNLPTRVIKFDEIELSDVHRLRENDNADTIERYKEIYRRNMVDGVLTKTPFPPCAGFINEESKFVPTAGRHRIIAGLNVGVKEFPCIIHPDEKSAVWYGLGDNRMNGLHNRPGDLKKMVRIALTKYPEKGYHVIAEIFDCSPEYVRLIANQLSSTCQLPEKRTGRDGKLYPAKKPRKAATTPLPETPKETTERPEIVQRKTLTDPIHEAAIAEPALLTETDHLSASGCPMPTPVKTPLSPLAPLTPDDFISRFKEAVQSLAVSDREKIELYKSMTNILYDSFQDASCRLEFLRWSKEKIEKYAQKEAEQEQTHCVPESVSKSKLLTPAPFDIPPASNVEIMTPYL